jgi:hypothetical protein
LREIIATGSRSVVKKIIPPTYRAVVRRTYDQVLHRIGIERAYRDLRSVESPLVTFNQKLVYKMAHDRRPILHTFADKYAARKFISQRVGATYLPALLAVVGPGREIPWTLLPKEFVAKSTHGSGASVIVFELADADARLPSNDESIEWGRFQVRPENLVYRDLQSLCNRWMTLGYEWTPGGHPEWAYRGIRRRVAFEEFLHGETGGIPVDFKFFVFDGKCIVVMDDDRSNGHHRDVFTPSWERLPVRFNYPNSQEPMPAPATLPEMVQVAEALGQGLDFVRVDLYDIAGRVYVGELTNYPDAATGRFEPASFDEWLGSHWTLPRRYQTPGLVLREQLQYARWSSGRTVHARHS